MKNILGTILFASIAVATVVFGFPYLILFFELGLRFDIARFALVGIAPIAFGVVLWLAAAGSFISEGSGTPAPTAPPRNLVSNRVFGAVRNPMYVAVIAILFGESILFQSVTLIIYTLVVWLAFHLFVVCYEEPHLKKIFGKKYLTYLEQVPRWLPKKRADRH